MLKKIETILKYILLYISIAGIVTFSLFIFEESFQTVMFGSWAAQDAQNWALVKEGTELLTRINRSMIIVNYTAGWIQPLAFLSYRSYGKAGDYYIKALVAKTLAHKPELFLGKNITIDFVPNRQMRLASGEIWASSGKIHATLPNQKIKPVYRLSGRLVKDKKGLKIEIKRN